MAGKILGAVGIGTSLLLVLLYLGVPINPIIPFVIFLFLLPVVVFCLFLIFSRHLMREEGYLDSSRFKNLMIVFTVLALLVMLIGNLTRWMNWPPVVPQSILLTHLLFAGAMVFGLTDMIKNWKRTKSTLGYQYYGLLLVFGYLWYSFHFQHPHHVHIKKVYPNENILYQQTFTTPHTFENINQTLYEKVFKDTYNNEPLNLISEIMADVISWEPIFNDPYDETSTYRQKVGYTSRAIKHYLDQYNFAINLNEAITRWLEKMATTAQEKNVDFSAAKSQWNNLQSTLEDIKMRKIFAHPTLVKEMQIINEIRYQILAIENYILTAILLDGDTLPTELDSL